MVRLAAFLLACFAVAASALAAVPEQESRVALVVGNAAYRHAHPLANPVNDANAMAETLRRLGFEVVTATDTDRVGMVRALGQFRKAMRADGIGLFYYAGHGMQVRGHNYLLPVDADISDENDAALLAIDLETVQNEMERAGVRLSLYILDACRDDPFERRFRSAGSRGLAPIDAARGSVIAFATAPGKTAADGSGEHGLFTGELLKTIVQPSLELEDVLKQTAAGVEKNSGNQQTPWYNSAFHGHFYFAPATVNVTSAANAAPPAGAVAAQRELVFWETIKSSTDPADFEDFLKRFPDSEFASLAQRRIAALRAPAPASPGPQTAAAAPAPTSPARAPIAAPAAPTTSSAVTAARSEPEPEPAQGSVSRPRRPTTSAFDGRYAGTSPPIGRCHELRFTVTVIGGRLRGEGTNGPSIWRIGGSVAEDGSFTGHSGGQPLTGRFEGSEFRGSFPSGHRGCSERPVTMQRVVPEPPRPAN